MPYWIRHIQQWNGIQEDGEKIVNSFDVHTSLAMNETELDWVKMHE